MNTKKSNCLGELLADIANGLNNKRVEYIESTGDRELDELCIARIKLALDLRKKPDVLFRSIIEKRDQLRIVRELY